MHAPPLVIMAEIAIPDARHCLIVAAPVIGLMAAVAIISRMDQIMDRLFPNLEWERRLGWLNFGAQRRADRVLRWIGYFIYAVLCLALLGIVWAAKGLVETLNNWSDPYVLSELARRIPVLLACLGLWLVYLGCELLPKMRGQYEEEELEKFRIEQEEVERERQMNPALRGKMSFQKPRLNTPAASNRMRPRR